MNLDVTQLLIILLLVDKVIDGVIAWRVLGRLLGDKPPVIPPITPPVEPPVVPPVVIPPPVVLPPPAAPRNNNIIATYFTDAMGAYGPIDPKKPGVALPAAFASPRPRVRVWTIDGSKYVDCDIVDKGPWYDGTAARPADPYWTTGSHPRAENDHHTNGAGIDLTPPAVSALGFNKAEGKWRVNWDFIDARTPPPSQVITRPIVPSTVTLQPNNWPTQAQVRATYGNPDDSGWEAANLVKVSCPWLLTLAGTSTHATTLTVNKHCADSLSRVLQYIWEQCGKSQDEINRLEYNIFSGAYNNRNIGGTNTKSMHAYGIALDFDDSHNQQHTKGIWTDESLIVRAFKAESWSWGGDWSLSSIDPMHFQAARVS